MPVSALLKKTAQVLDRLNVPFMLTGSLASSFLGEPRATHDIDMVVDLACAQVDSLLAEFPPPHYYVSREAAIEAVDRRGMFNVVDTEEGDKVDFWLLTDEAFDRSRFERRQRVQIEGVSVDVSSPEDTILMKLRWSRDSGGSERQLRDAIGVYEVQHGALDRVYIEHWIQSLELTAQWQRLLAEAEPLE